MLPSEQIMQDYDTYLQLLKFAIKNDNKPEYRDFYLVNNYNQLLSEIETNLEDKLEEKITTLDAAKYDSLINAIFGKDLQEYLPLINSNNKKKLIENFEIIMTIYDIASDRCYEDEEEGGLQWLEDINKEIRKIKELFSPIIKKIEKI